MAGLQLGGIVSGMDTQSTIDQLMTIDKQKITTKQTKISNFRELLSRNYSVLQKFRT